MAAILRVVLNFIVAGALGGILVASYLGPRYVQWDNSVGSSDTAMCVCSKKAREGADKLLDYQMTGALAGSIVGLALSIGFVLWRRARAKANPPKPPTSPPPPAPTSLPPPTTSVS